MNWSARGAPPARQTVCRLSEPTGGGGRRKSPAVWYLVGG